jgi:hypothetical protein
MNDIIDSCKQYNIQLDKRLFVVLKNFRESRQMLQHAVNLLDDPRELVAIPSKPVSYFLINTFLQRAHLCGLLYIGKYQRRRSHWYPQWLQIISRHPQRPLNGSI